MAKKKAETSKTKEHMLFNFQHSITPMTGEDWGALGQEQPAYLTARICGYYFEGQILEYMAATYGGTAELDGDQQKAKNAFEVKLAAYNPTSENGKKAKAAGLELQAAIKQGAKIAGDSWYKALKKYCEGKNATITIGNISHHNALGDIEAIIDDGVKKEKIILEAKWQNTPDKPVQWFQLIDSSLFGQNNFEQYLRNTGWWEYKIPNNDWEKAVATTVLGEFLSSQISPSAAGQLRYLLSKGTSKPPDFDISSKWVAHGMKQGVEVKNLAGLADALGVTQTRTSTMQGINFYAKQKFMLYTMAFLNNSDEEAAWFGIDSLKNDQTLTGKDREIGKKFSFKMWVAQKAFR